MASVWTFNLKGQIFTHIDPVTRVETVFASSEIRAHCDRTIMPQVTIPITLDDAKMIRDYRGVERYRLERACRTKLWLPLLFAHMPDGSHLLIDGSHTYCARALLGHHHANAYIVPQEIWTWFTVEGLPTTTEEELANSWSGVL